MERYRQAMERARLERERVQADRDSDAPGRAEPPAAPAQIPAQAAAAPPAAAPRAPTPPGAQLPAITYTHTRVVPIDARKLRTRCVITGVDADPFADAYRMLRTRLLRRMRQNGWQSVAITSPGSSAGKSLTAVNLAISMAMEVTSTVLLVDFDLRRPSIHRYFDYTPELGISDYLLHGASLSEILFSPSIDRLVIVPGRESLANSTELIAAPRTLELVAEFKARYPERIVVFDLPPVLTVSDALAFAPHVDGILLVVEEGATQEDELAATLEVLEGTNIIGTVLNKAEELQGTYYHY
jgi:capsular exopolysaccharide synthesis family protein